MQQIQIAHSDYKVSDFVSWQRNGLLVLSPSFQRRPVWSPGAKSYLIDTVVRNLPMPVIFLRELPVDLRSREAKREVVDGQQRIRTLISFVAPELLPEFDSQVDDFTVKKSHNKDIAGKRFSELNPRVRQRILEYNFTAHIFPADTDDREILQIFARMNSTGVRLNSQELRNAEFFGEFKTLMYDLAAEQLTRWRNWGVFTEARIARMDEVELVSELAQLMVEGIVARSQSAIRKLYDRFDDTCPGSEQIARRFRAVMDALEDKLGTKPIMPFDRRPLFYCLFAVAYDQMFGLHSSLKAKKAKPLSVMMIDRVKRAGVAIMDGTAPGTVLEASARRTTHLASRTAIIDFVKKGPK